MEESPDPDLNAMHLLASAAPASYLLSEEDPAEGKVKVTVEVVDASSVTMVKPLGRVVMLGVDAVALVGEVDGMSGNSCDMEKIAEKFLFVVALWQI